MPAVSGAPSGLLPDHEDHAGLPLLHHAPLQSHRLRHDGTRVRERQGKYCRVLL